MHKKNIGILTWHYYSNFGSALQAYALQTLITRLGYNTKIINYRNKKFGNPRSGTNQLKKWMSLLPLFLRNIKPLRNLKLNSIRFRYDYLNETSLVTDIREMKKLLPNRFDTLVFGSDQIWAPNVFNPIYMGVGLPNNIKKVSYAASIGLNHIPENLVEMFQKQLSTFRAVSVREDEGKQLLESIGIKPVYVVLDPTLMLDISIYRKMEKSVNIPYEPFLFCYFLNKNHLYKKTVVEYAENMGLKVVGVSDNPDDNKWMHTLENINANNFLWLVSHANTIFTDSYHGSIFSLLYHKNLFIFKRFSETDSISQNSRIRRLCKLFNIDERLLDEQSVLKNTSIDYNYFEEVLKRERELSESFLANALS